MREVNRRQRLSDLAISFDESDKPPVQVPHGAVLSEVLNVQNSPILFGCRIGICGTCAVEVIESQTPLHPRTAEEEEFLEGLAPGRPGCRLACQIRINTNIKIRKVEI